MTAVTDIYAAIIEADVGVVETLATAMEVSAADEQHRDMVIRYLSDLDLPDRAQALEIGCGTGAIARTLAVWPGIRSVVGVDPSPVLIEKGRVLAAGIDNLSFREGDGQRLAFPDSSFDLVVAHRVLSHIPAPEPVLVEAFRVLRPGGSLAVFDGDYATITVALGDPDPLQTCVRAFAPAYITDAWIARRLPAMVRAAGFVKERVRSHGYVQIDDPAYMLSIVARGADALVAAGRIGKPLAEALVAEAERRVEANAFFGHIGYLSLTAVKPA